MSGAQWDSLIDPTAQEGRDIELLVIDEQVAITARHLARLGGQWGDLIADMGRYVEINFIIVA